MPKDYTVRFSYQILSVDENGVEKPMHAVKEGDYTHLAYDDLVGLEAAIMGALGSLGLAESDKKKKK